MEVELSRVTDLLSRQDYLSYERLLSEMLLSVTRENEVIIRGTETRLRTSKEVDDFNRKMIQVHGIYGLI